MTLFVPWTVCPELCSSSRTTILAASQMNAFLAQSVSLGELPCLVVVSYSSHFQMVDWTTLCEKLLFYNLTNNFIPGLTGVPLSLHAAADDH